VHEVDHDRYVHAARLGFGADPSELVVVAVDQRDQVRCWSGSRRVASSNTWPITGRRPR